LNRQTLKWRLAPEIAGYQTEIESLVEDLEVDSPEEVIDRRNWLRFKAMELEAEARFRPPPSPFRRRLH